MLRLSRNGLITRLAHRNLYALTPDGPRFAIFYTKAHDRVLRPLIGRRSAPGPAPAPPGPPRHRRRGHPAPRRRTAPRGGLTSHHARATDKPDLKTQDHCQSPNH